MKETQVTLGDTQDDIQLQE